MKSLTRKDFVNVANRIDTDVVYQDCLKFLCQDHKYVDEANLVHMKDDPITMLSLYRLYQLHFVAFQLMSLGTLARNVFRVKNVALPASLLGN